MHIGAHDLNLALAGVCPKQADRRVKTGDAAPLPLKLGQGRLGGARFAHKSTLADCDLVTADQPGLRVLLGQRHGLGLGQSKAEGQGGLAGQRGLVDHGLGLVKW